MSIDRRRVVQAALIAAWWPGYWAHASSAPWPPDRTPPGTSPRLLFVVPAVPGAREVRGMVLGAMLTYGDDALLAALALCDVSCVAAADIATYGLAETDEPWFVLVEPGGSPVRTAAVSVGPALPLSKRRRRKNEEDDPRHVDDAGFERLVRAADRQLARLVLPDRSALVRYAAAAGPDSTAALALDGWDDRGIDGATLEHLALRGRLASVFHEIPGSRWWSHGGPCGGGGPEHPTPEERAAMSADARAGAECGMAHVPRLAYRALRFL